MSAQIGRIERQGEVVAEAPLVHVLETPDLQSGWRGSFILDLIADPHAGDWVTQLHAGPQDPGCQLTLADGRVGTFHIESFDRRSSSLAVDFVGTGPLE